MAYNFSVTINVLPSVGEEVFLYYQFINTSNDSLSTSFDTGSVTVLYGNVQIPPQPVGPGFYFIANDINPIALLCTANKGGINYDYIFYTNAIYAQEVPNNFNRISQKVPLGIFPDINSETIIGQLLKAKALMVDDYYSTYFDVQKEVFSSAYSPELEFQYNGTVGLLSNSAHPEDLFHLFSTLVTYGLNAYDLELFVSQYIYFRRGTVSAVYIINDPAPIKPFWILGIDGFTELGAVPPQTILAPEDYNPILQNITWKIFNSGSFSQVFKTEIENLILRISRADIGNSVIFLSDVTPPDSQFDLIGPTYKNDPRLIFGKVIEYKDKSNYPLNIIGYKVKTS